MRGLVRQRGRQHFAVVAVQVDAPLDDPSGLALHGGMRRPTRRFAGGLAVVLSRRVQVQLAAVRPFFAVVIEPLAADFTTSALGGLCGLLGEIGIVAMIDAEILRFGNRPAVIHTIQVLHDRRRLDTHRRPTASGFLNLTQPVRAFLLQLGRSGQRQRGANFGLIAGQKFVVAGSSALCPLLLDRRKFAIGPVFAGRSGNTLRIGAVRLVIKTSGGLEMSVAEFLIGLADKPGRRGQQYPVFRMKRIVVFLIREDAAPGQRGT